jgi:flagellar hook-associated protein 3 FlgL
LASADIILNDLRAALAGQVTVADIETAMNDWFGSGGGYETVAYTGGTSHMSAFHLGDGERVDLKIKGDDAAFKITLKSAAMAALSADPALVLSDETRAAMLDRAGEISLNAVDSLTVTRAALGHAEARIEDASIRLTAQNTSLEIARTELLSADPYDTIVKLEATQFRLESLYTATAKLSQLSLVGFLR